MEFCASSLKIGIICGTGLNDPDIFTVDCEKDVSTPFGKPSHSLLIGKIGAVNCVLLPRHGIKHDRAPSYINYRANIFALQAEGCTHVIATTACGSLQEEIGRGDIVVLNDFIDRTSKREASFYDGKPGSPNGICHIPMNDPFCGKSSKILAESCKELGYSHHNQGTVVTIEGPRFSSTAESKWFKSMGCHVVNMTSLPEICLAREAGMAFASIALVTDYDSWREGESVTVEEVMKSIKELAAKAVQVIVKAVNKFAAIDWTEDIKKNQDMAKSAVF